jgi:hypothetical protein
MQIVTRGERIVLRVDDDVVVVVGLDLRERRCTLTTNRHNNIEATTTSNKQTNKQIFTTNWR